MASETVTVIEAFEQKLWEQPGVVLWHTTRLTALRSIDRLGARWSDGTEDTIGYVLRYDRNSNLHVGGDELLWVQRKEQAVSDTVTVAAAYERKLWEQPGVVLRHDGHVVRHLVQAAANSSDVRYWETADQDGGGVRVNMVSGQEVIEVERAIHNVRIFIPKGPPGIAADIEGRELHVEGDWARIKNSPYFGLDVARDEKSGWLLVGERQEDKSSHKWVVVAWVAIGVAVVIMAVVGVLVLRGVR